MLPSWHPGSALYHGANRSAVGIEAPDELEWLPCLMKTTLNIIHDRMQSVYQRRIKDEETAAVTVKTEKKRHPRIRTHINTRISQNATTIFQRSVTTVHDELNAVLNSVNGNGVGRGGAYRRGRGRATTRRAS